MWIEQTPGRYIWLEDTESWANYAKKPKEERHY